MAQSPWDGTWLVDTQRTHLRPDDLVIRESDSVYMIGEAPDTHSFRCDGKDYPAPGERTSRCEQRAHTILTTEQLAGKVLETRSFEVAQDGRSLTVATTSMRSSPASTVRQTYARTGVASQTIAGSWRGLTTEIKDVVYIMRVHDGYFYFNDTLEGAVSDTKLDGTPGKFQGAHPQTPHGPTLKKVHGGSREPI